MKLTVVPGFSRLVLVIAIVLQTALATTAFAAGPNTTPDNAQALDLSKPSVSDTLVGSTGGAYRYYQVSYQGGDAPVLFSLAYQPSYGGGNQAFGFNLYGPSGLTFAGQVTGTSGNAATAQFTLVNGAAMNVLVQVYNYTNGGSVDYTLTVSGLSGGSAAVVVGKGNTTSGQAIGLSTVNSSLGGSIAGTAAGAFHYYTLHYPGGNSSLSISMNATPNYTGSGQAVGFHVYRQTPSGSGPQITGSVVANDQYSTTYSATITDRSASDYQLQVYNYWPGVSVNYGITITGAAGPAPMVSGNLDSAHAVVLNSAQPGATGTLVGNRGGAFNDFLVTYPGNNSTFNLSITYPSTGGASPTSLGFKVYDGATLVTTIIPSDDGSGVMSGIWGYKDASAKTFGIQVFNYADNSSATYILYQVGAQ